MKKLFVIIFLIASSFLINIKNVGAQCSICAKSVQQMGDKPAKGFNSGIIYMMLVPYVAMGVIGYKWWKHNR